MMDRRTRAEWMRLLHSELSEPAAKELRERIRGQPDQERSFLALERQWQSLELPESQPAPAGFATRVTDRAREAASEGVAPVWWSRTLAGRLATAAVLAGGVVVGALLAPPSESEEWNDYLSAEPNMAESYLAGIEASGIDNWQGDES